MRYGRRVARAVILGLTLAALIAPGCARRLPTASHSARPQGLPGMVPSPTPALPVDPTDSPDLTGGPLVWIAGDGILTVLSPGGWRSFALPGIVRDIAVDAEGNAILAPGLCMCDGGLLRNLLPAAPGGEQDAVAVDPQGRIWVGYLGGIAVLSDGRWQEIPLQGTPARIVRDLAVDGRGSVWVATEAGLSCYNSSGWTHYGEGSELGSVSVECLLVDHDGCIWVGHDNGLSMLQGGAWLHFPLELIDFFDGLLARHDGAILAASRYRGIWSFDGSSWTVLADRNSGLADDWVTALAEDSQGRLWAGTRQGLSVYDEGRWRTYQEANSGLGDNRVLALATGGGALASLPPLEMVRYGRFSGSVVIAGQPVAGARVVLCPELSLGQDFIDSPCEGEPFERTGYTASDGTYAFDWVPVGHYAVAAEIAPGRWATRTRMLDAVRYRVREGETTVAEPIVGTE